MSTKKVFASFPWTYMGQRLERGEIFTTRNSPRDDQLEGLKYFHEYKPAQHDRKKCDACGKEFVGIGSLMEHRRKPDCFAEPGEPTRMDTAHLLDADVERVHTE